MRVVKMQLEYSCLKDSETNIKWALHLHWFFIAVKGEADAEQQKTWHP